MKLLIVALSLTLAASPALADRCLNLKDVTSTHFVNDQTMTVKTKQNRKYTVTFTNACAAKQWPQTYFVYEQWTQQCVTKGDAIPTNNYGPCFVRSVTQNS
ncbi:MAG TPA: hypothetical protein VHL34_16535 [Rhizomicrobium sp.]|jgi:predicted lipoprotein with Yx(FWY)xxD motif|nr:hypothetical protein [Rhizomicrobium sp.]